MDTHDQGKKTDMSFTIWPNQAVNERLYTFIPCANTESWMKKIFLQFFVN